MKTATRSHWSSKMAFTLAAAGSAIGLGNIWKFPYIAGVNGGGAFVLVYLICIAFVGIPIFIAELYIGQQSQSNVVDAFTKLSPKGRFWSISGWLGLVAAFLILSLYSVVAGWIFDFEFRSLMLEFSNQNEEQIKGVLGQLFNSPLRQTLWHVLFMAATTSVVLSGLNQGLERCNKILMPTLLLILIGLFVHSLSLSGFSKALQFLFVPDFNKLSPPALLEAVGHSFFTLSLGMGAIMTYGSYLKKEESLPKMAFQIAFLDTAIALITGIVIFSIVFTFNLEPGKGPGLIFSTLPTLFSQLPGGSFLSIVFFLLVSFAALTSSVSILEVIVSFLTERCSMSRTKASLLSGLTIALAGLPNILSMNLWSEFRVFNKTYFDLIDLITSSYLLPLGGLITCLYYAWVIGPKSIQHTLQGHSSWAQWGLLWSARLIAPLAVLLVLYNMAIGF